MRLKKKQNRVNRSILKSFFKAKPSPSGKNLDAFGFRNFSINLHLLE